MSRKCPEMCILALFLRFFTSFPWKWTLLDTFNNSIIAVRFNGLVWEFIPKNWHWKPKLTQISQYLREKYIVQCRGKIQLILVCVMGLIFYLWNESRHLSTCYFLYIRNSKFNGSLCRNKCCHSIYAQSGIIKQAGKCQNVVSKYHPNILVNFIYYFKKHDVRP